MLRALILCAALILGCLPEVQAADKAAAKSAPVELVHVAPTGKQLPPPGELMTLTVTLKKTKDSERKLRAFVVRDGQMLDLSVPSAQYNQQEEPFYEVPMYAPEGEILYLFLLYNPDGTVTRSDRYFVRRPCLPEIALTSGKVDQSLQPDAKLVELIDQSVRLNRDIKLYETALGLLRELQKLIGER